MPINRDTVQEFWSQESLDSIIKLGCKEYVSALPHFKDYICVSHERIYDFVSGRASLEWLLRNLRTQKTQVLVPAFTCSVVEKAISESGLTCHPYDFSEKIGLYNWKSILETSSDVAAIIVTHLFGSPIDFEDLTDICKRKNIAIIEDCAHCLGGTLNGLAAGSLGDASIFSFNYDKPVSLGWGGVACINNTDLFSDNKEVNRERPSFWEEVNLIARFSEWLRTRRDSIRQLGSSKLRCYHAFRKILNMNPSYNPPLVLLGPLRSQLLALCLTKYDAYLNTRNHNANRIVSSIPLQTWPTSGIAQPAWIKLKVNCNSEQSLKRASRFLCSNGIRAGNFNWPSLLTGCNSHTHPLAAIAASSWIDIPVHQDLSEANISLIIKTVSSLGS